eukprot:CAMPEP_0197004808 /NCGR_PEP_ID=MMETSP1380-20130617/25737_1 /TAXON_ID=5936 /ORGANISM="Euplotes crassus, Strain CT5" /LENGTH=371 /DNA_ID=CAMNT_0042423725 /DNA_START=200 /DNA_END=1313 /DNA_ORIENTATION=+
MCYLLKLMRIKSLHLLKSKSINKIFSSDDFGGMKVTKATAVIDLYVHPVYEPQGEKKKLIDHIVECEKINGEQTVDLLGTSPKFLSSAPMSPSDSFSLSRAPGYNSELGRSSSQTNLSALKDQEKHNDMRRSKVFNTIAQDVIKVTPESSNYQRDNHLDTQRRIKISESERKFNSNEGYASPRHNNKSPYRKDYDQNYYDYQKKKETLREVSPPEHRSKYYNDVFASTVNMGPMKSSEYSRKSSPRLREPEIRGKIHYEHKSNLSSNFAVKDSQKDFKPNYVPQIPQDYKIQLDEKDIVKPKNRFKNWQPVMRNLDASNDIKGVQISNSKYLTERDDYVNPARRVQIGGKKIFVSKERGMKVFLTSSLGSR